MVNGTSKYAWIERKGNGRLKKCARKNRTWRWLSALSDQSSLVEAPER
jgi:hypothetical protein